MVAHDTHFLTRIERLERTHAELALALYHDSELVRYVLSKLDLPDAVERVAISLDDPEQGPFIIVARDGAFVTCLGKGMRPGDGQPRVTRRRLDTLSRHIEGLRRAIDEAETSTSHCRRLVRKVLDAGDRLSREEFDELVGLAPLLYPEYFHALVSAVATSTEAYGRLERARRLTAPRHATALRVYWNSTWSMAHFALLLAADGPRFLTDVFDRVEAMSPEYVGQRAELLPWVLTRLGVTSFAARGAWVASKIPRVLLPDLKKSWAEAGTPNTSMSFGLGLSAIGLRHRRLRAEVRKVLARPEPPGEEPLAAALRKVFSAGYDTACEAPEPLREAVSETAHKVLEQISKGLPNKERALAEFPDEVAVSVLLSMPLGLHDVDTLVHLLMWLPWVVKAEARDFYLPARYLDPADEWKRREAVMLIEPRRKHDHPRGSTSVDPTAPRRKGPCPCGSGKKYKRCCGADKG
ncbi:MAG: SEC-C metal-binding domain-containing protein [Myxococcota bacterium]